MIQLIAILIALWFAKGIIEALIGLAQILWALSTALMALILIGLSHLAEGLWKTWKLASGR